MDKTYHRLWGLIVILILHSSLFVLNSRAQDSLATAKTVISGTLIDKEEQEPLLQATVQVLKAADSTYVNGAVSPRTASISLRLPISATRA